MKISLSKISTPPSQIPFGLDISDFYIRVAQLKKESNKSFSLYALHEIPIPQGVISQGMIINENKLTQLIKKVTQKDSESKKNHKITSREAITALPEPKTFIKLATCQWPQNYEEENGKINIDNRRQKLLELLKKQLRENIPLDLEQAQLDHKIIQGNLKTVQPGQKITVLAGTAPKKITESYTKLLENSGLIPVSLEIEGISIARAVINRKKQKEDDVKIIVDFGATRTGLIIYHNNLVRYSLSIPVSGKQITNEIAEKEKISFSQAEEIKISYNITRSDGSEVASVINRSLDEIVHRIKEAIMFCQLKIYSQQKPKIILCGGGANWNGLEKFLSKKLNSEVTIADPWINLNKKPAFIKKEKSLSYTTAIGLALGGLYDYS